MSGYSRVPVDYMADEIRRYVERGVPPGSFLTALLSNDLKEAFRMADDSNAKAMRAWVVWMVSEMPWKSQGSPERVAAWIARGGLSGGARLQADEEEPE
jgi:hypothetical protein